PRPPAFVECARFRADLAEVDRNGTLFVVVVLGVDGENHAQHHHEICVAVHLDVVFVTAPPGHPVLLECGNLTISVEWSTSAPCAGKGCRWCPGPRTNTSASRTSRFETRRSSHPPG